MGVSARLPPVTERALTGVSIESAIGGPIRSHAWWNAGFGSLRNIMKDIEDHEPWFEPTVVPLPGRNTSGKGKAADESLPAPQPGTRRNRAYPAATYYSVEDYRQLYLSGEVTPEEVANYLLK